jgi:hypothetical protein
VGRTVGRVAGEWRLMETPTPGAANSGPAALAHPGVLRINEWMARAPGDDWFELYNPAGLPVELTGLCLTDDPSIAGTRRFQVGPLSFAGAGNWTHFIADGEVRRGGQHVNFSLNGDGEMIRLSSRDGVEIDSVSFGLQRSGVSEGRLPDGAAHIVVFERTASPGFANYLENPDSDGDGMPDEWELMFGLDPKNPSDALKDRDGDGMTNLEEYIAGTDPRSANSALALRAQRIDEAAVLLIFQVAPGRRAWVETRAAFDDAWGTLVELPARDQAATHELEVSISGNRFYRLAVSID